MIPGVQPIMPGAHSSVVSPPDELLFFERAKRTLESKDTYEEFLKLLNLYSKDIIDTKMLVDLAQAFLGDGELLSQFKEITGYDERQDNVEYGPPGSIRTGPPEPVSAQPHATCARLTLLSRKFDWHVQVVTSFAGPF